MARLAGRAKMSSSLVALAALSFFGLCGATRVRAQETGEEEKSEEPAKPAEAAGEEELEPPAPADEPSPYEHFEPIYSRWFAPGNPAGGLEPLPYEINERAEWWNPYTQNWLKGDFPILGTEDIFLALTITDRVIVGMRNVPVGSGPSGPDDDDADEDFFGDGRQSFLVNDLALSLDLFKEPQAFKPVDWRVKATGVFNYSKVETGEVGVVDVDITTGTERNWRDFALQEFIVEKHLFDISDRYDFISAEAGIIPFRSDFRGFVFDDANRGVRLSGNYDENKWQYNLLFFNMLDKDTNSGLNEFEDRGQEVYIANVYRQDFPVKGITEQLSFHFSDDHRGFEFDDNGFLVSPAPIGLAAKNKVRAFYLGWTGEGHLGWLNVTHAFYQAWGEDTNNPIAARDVDIDAQLAAVELSRDFDWLRVRVFGLYQSGDDDARDGRAGGFDSILDAPNFAGGELSFFNSQAVKLLGVNLTNAGSPLADLRSSKTQGHANFVNPGLQQIGGAVDVEITPTLKAVVGSSYLRFDNTETLETFLELPEVEREIGVEVFMGTQWRPLLTNNMIFSLGASALLPGDAFQRIYQSDQTLYSVFLATQLTF